MPETIGKTKTRRGTQRGQVKKLIDKAEDIIKKEESFTQEDIDLMTATIGTINEKKILINKYDEKIADALNDADLEEELETADDYDIEVNEKLVRFRHYLTKMSIVKPSPPTVDPLDTSISSDSASGSTSTDSSSRTRKVNLPKLTLSTFDGDILQWQGFFDGFTAAIDNDNALDNIQKMQYLKAQLRGTAAKAIEGLSLTNTNYDNAKAILQERFGQPFKVQSAYMKALWTIPKPTGDLSSLRSFSDSLESYIRGLQSLGKNEDSYGDLLVHMVLDKLPWNIRQSMAREHKSDTWNLKDLRKCLVDEINAIQAGANALDTTSTNAFSDSHGYAQSAQALHTNAKNQPKVHVHI